MKKRTKSGGSRQDGKSEEKEETFYKVTGKCFIEERCSFSISLDLSDSRAIASLRGANGESEGANARLVLCKREKKREG